MPLLTLAEWVALNEDDVIYLRIGNDEAFAPIEKAASDIVVKKTGLEVPADADDAPSWCKLPMGLICTWVAASRNKGLSADFRDDTNVKYKAALDILADNKVKSTKGVARSGNITEKYSW